MTGPYMTIKFLPVPCAVALLITAAVAYLLARRFEKWPAVLLAGLAIPAALVGIGLYHAATSPDGPRAMLLIGTLCVAAAAAPFTLIVSRLAVGFARG